MPQKKITPRFLGTCLLVVVGVTLGGVAGWLQYGPENNVRIWLDRTEVERAGLLTLYIRNLGSRSIGFGSRYSVYKIHDNGTETEMSYDWAWTAELSICRPFTTRPQRIKVDFDPGRYYVMKYYSLLDENYESMKKLSSMKLYFTVL